MTLAELLGFEFQYRAALIVGTLLAMAACLIVTPRAIAKLRGAGIIGTDRHKEDRRKIPEMGGLAVFVAFNVGAFATLGLADLEPSEQSLILASLIVVAGACFTGALDDLIVLQQKFKAGIPLAFSIPLALFVADPTIAFPVIGMIDFGVFYPLLLVPAAIACASNGYNMLEGFNGLGTGLGLVTSSALAVIIILTGDFLGLAVLAPLIGALAAFWFYNSYPAKFFPGDTLTLMVGAVIACAAILGKVEFWGAVLLLPHVVEFFLKAKGRFKDQSFGDRMEDGKIIHEGPIRSLTHATLRWGGSCTEKQLVRRMVLADFAFAGLITLAAVSI